MSHKATTWLASIEPKSITAGEFRALFHLCDCHNPSNGCFPSQDWLMSKTGLSNSGLNKCLGALDAKGIISRKIRFDPKTRRRKSTMYVLGFDLNPTPQSGEGANSTLGAEPTPLSPQSQLHPSGDKPVKEPVKEPVKAPLTPKGESVDLIPEFERMWNFYPRKVGKGAARKAFFKARGKASLSEIAHGMKGFVDNINGTPMDKIPHAATWLNQERWLDNQAHATNRAQTSEDDMRSLGAATAESDMGALFGADQLSIEGKPNGL